MGEPGKVAGATFRADVPGVRPACARRLLGAIVPRSSMNQRISTKDASKVNR